MITADVMRIAACANLILGTAPARAKVCYNQLRDRARLGNGDRLIGQNLAATAPTIISIRSLKMN
jgi:hypothetical protein